MKDKETIKKLNIASIDCQDKFKLSHGLSKLYFDFGERIIKSCKKLTYQAQKKFYNLYVIYRYIVIEILGFMRKIVI